MRIPQAAHRAGSQDEIVLVVDGKARIVRVVHALAEDGSWLVRDGVRASDVVLVAPDAELKDGDEVSGLDLH
jgi:molybdopterin converting factor small subunit